MAAGANVKAVQRMLGQASASMTLDAYAGLFGADLDAVANRLDEVVAGAGCGLFADCHGRRQRGRPRETAKPRR
ncbi:hypothetical protein NCC78_06850 [Micromonospora phytophila]|uniref:hypothetical protein n=1 Tax=Micromonospora phytophila TaxID=709888 RepID=UPI00202ECEB2|nr:hypothetical protein [Micromonospora phytophila]MCM0674407.1 hypothetical protein [Micromonospora phytophila]